jgi:hypothetical protein
MDGRKREGTDEIPRGRWKLRRRQRGYKAHAEVDRDAAWEVGGGHSSEEGGTVKPAGAKGLYSSQAFKEGRTA